MTLTALALSLAFTAQQPAPDQTEEGCGYVPGSRQYVQTQVGVFFSDVPFIDDNYRAVRVGSEWRKSAQTPYSGAKDRAWFKDDSVLEIDGRRYRKYGFARILSFTDVQVTGEYDGIGVFAEAGTAGLTDVVYLPTRGGQCEFQPYEAV